MAWRNGPYPLRLKIWRTSTEKLDERGHYLAGTVSSPRCGRISLLQSSANAQEKLKIGIITTLSAAAGAVPGQQQNGFELAVKMLGGKPGTRQAEIVVAD